MSDTSPFDDEAPATHGSPNLFAGYRPATMQAIGIVTVVCLLGNIFLPWVFWDSLPEWLFPATFAFGGVAAQIAILSVWAGMGSDPLRLRLSHTATLVCVVCGSYIVGLQVPDFPNSGMPRIVAYIIFGGGLAGWVLAALAYLVLSALTKTRIAHLSAASNHQQNNRLSIAYVIGVTTAVAFGVAVLPKIMPSSVEPVPQDQQLVIALMGLQHILFCLACLVVSTWAMLSTKHNFLYIVALGALVPLSIFANLWLLGSYPRVRIDNEMLAAVAGFTLGFVTFVNAMLGVARWLGYRVVSA